MTSFLKEILDDFVALFFPNYCHVCYGPTVTGETKICTHCLLQLPLTTHFKDQSNPLFEKLSVRVKIKHAMALLHFNKRGKAQRILHVLKYKNQPEIGVLLGKFCGTKLGEADLQTEFDCILAIPLHPKKLKHRGYNQSAKLAEGISEKLNIPFYNVLSRIKATETQTRKSKLARWLNIEDVFLLENKELIAGKRVLLVDDVITTGATIEACAQAIRKSDCLSISVLCIAYTN
jgi:ComF family protein